MDQDAGHDFTLALRTNGRRRSLLQVLGALGAAAFAARIPDVEADAKKKKKKKRKQGQCSSSARLCPNGGCVAADQCCASSECGQGAVCTDLDHVCCPSERIATHNPIDGAGTCGCCCTATKCQCPCGDLCSKARGECLTSCCCDEGLCDCAPAGAGFPYTSCCPEGWLGDIGGDPGCCTGPGAGV